MRSNFTPIVIAAMAGLVILFAIIVVWPEQDKPPFQGSTPTPVPTTDVDPTEVKLIVDQEGREVVYGEPFVVRWSAFEQGHPSLRPMQYCYATGDEIPTTSGTPWTTMRMAPVSGEHELIVTGPQKEIEIGIHCFYGPGFSGEAVLRLSVVEAK